jgi:hypothetical protein
MSVALKYACFELFMIPTEEMIDPDSEVHEVIPKKAPAKTTAKAPATVTPAKAPATVTTAAKVPADPVPPVLEYLAKEREAFRIQRDISKAENNAIWKSQVAALTAAKMIPDKPLAEFTQHEAEDMIAAMYANFTTSGTVLVDGRKPS